MRVIALALILGIAGFMAYLWLKPICSDGLIVQDEEECGRYLGANLCRDAFAGAAAIAARSGATYNSDAACRQDWPVCDLREPQGYGPRPSRWCVASAPGATRKISPLYLDRRQ